MTSTSTHRTQVSDQLVKLCPKSTPHMWKVVLTRRNHDWYIVICADSFQTLCLGHQILSGLPSWSVIWFAYSMNYMQTDPRKWHLAIAIARKLHTILIIDEIDLVMLISFLCPSRFRIHIHNVVYSELERCVLYFLT